MEVNKEWLDLFPEEEQQQIYSFKTLDREHPLKRILFPRDPYAGNDNQVAMNTLTAFKFVNSSDKQWLSSLKSRMMEIKDYSTSSAALGELRAYGYLLEAGVKVKPVPCQRGIGTPEFECSFNGNQFIVEVHSKQMNNEETRAYQEFKKEEATAPFRMHTITPFGKPDANKPGDTVCLNAISKICATKQRGHQLSEEIPSIIWLDYQDEVWDMLLTRENLHPLRSFRGEFVSGEIWYAFYGWKGAPVFESHGLEEKIGQPPEIMQHDGRFRMSQELSSVIISLPRITSILENPWANKILPDVLWEPLSMLKWFSVTDSYTHKFTWNLKDKIDHECKSLVNLASSLKYKW
ncbi:hypothetical protein [Bacillus cereus]|uniref:hypothetical protein n=1 Tax=Bacillus cereus TaxID=1396 RepID=UPI001E33D234|nr:hypothetical protein [Bacillus cereus]MCD2338310.1 hypothetical protein [Bacillus cereus]